DLRDELRAMLAAAADWQREYAQVAIRAPGSIPVAEGKLRFDAFRTALAGFTGPLTAARFDARARLDHSARAVQAWRIGTGVVIRLSVLAAALILRRVIVLPLGRLAARARHVMSGHFDEPVTATGATEVVTLAGDVDAMRARIVEERDDLERSNQEL